MHTRWCICMFDIVAGVLQGNTLAPYLFIVILDHALRKATNSQEEELGFTIVPRRSRRMYPTVLTYLDFADDISLISNTKIRAAGTGGSWVSVPPSHL